MSVPAMTNLTAEESEVQELLREAVGEGTLCYSREYGEVELNEVYVGWDGDSVVDQLARNKDTSSIDVVEWTGEGHDGPLSDIIVYFVGPGRWLVKGLRRPRLSSRERAWLLGRQS